jgi:hypothetical protein
MLRLVALVSTDISVESVASIYISSQRASVIGNFFSSPVLVTLMMEVIRSSETSVLILVTLRNIPEDGILHNHRRENLISYINRKKNP